MLAGAAMASQLRAQSAKASSATENYPLDVAITYSATASNATGGSAFWMQGGSVQLHGQVDHGIGVVAEVSGMHTGNIHSSGVGLDWVTATFGPRYTWSPAHRKTSLFGQCLVGEVNAFHSVFPSPNGAIDSTDGLALQLGGGVNLALSPRLSLRALEATWLRTQLPNGATNVQNNLQLGSGFAFHFR
jgi:hypothetical protein